MQAAKILTKTSQIDAQEDSWEGKLYRNKDSKNNNNHIVTTAKVDKNTSLAGNTTLEEGIKYNAANNCKSTSKLQPTNTNTQNVLLTKSTENKEKSTKQHFSPLKRHIVQLRLENILEFLHTVQQNLCLLEQHCKQQKNEYYKQEEEVQEQIWKRQSKETCCKEEEELESFCEQCQSDNRVNEVHRQLKEIDKNFDDSNNNFANDNTNKFTVIDVISHGDCSKSTNDEINECSNSSTEDLVEHNQLNKCSVDKIMEEEEEESTTTIITTKEESNTNLIADMTQIQLSPSSVEYLMSVSGRQHIAKVKELCNKLSKAITTHQKYERVRILQTSLELSYNTLLRKAAIHSFQNLEQLEEEEHEEPEVNKSEKLQLEKSTPCKANVERTEQENYPLDTRCTMEPDNIVAEKNASLETIVTKEDNGSMPICKNAQERDDYSSNNNIKVHKCNVNALANIKVAKPSTCDTDNNFTVINSLSENNNNKENKKEREQKRELEQQSKLVDYPVECDKDYNKANEIRSCKANILCVSNTHCTTVHPLSHIIDQRNFTSHTLSENNSDSINNKLYSGKNNKANRYPRTLTQDEVRYILSQCDKLQEIIENKLNNALQHYNKTQQENVKEENSVYAIYISIGIQPLFTNNMHCSNCNNHYCQDHTQTTIKDATQQLHEHKEQKKQLQVMYYCRNVITTTLDDIVFTLLQALYKEQRELKRNKPLQFKAHQRYVVGLNETLKFLRSGRIKCVILAADIEVETEEAMTDVSNANNVDDNITESSEVHSTISDENNVYGKEKKIVNSDICCDNYESTPLSAEAHAKTSKEQKNVDTLSVSTNTKSANASTTRKRFQSLRAALTELAALCAGKKKMMCGSNYVNGESNNTWKDDDENKLIQSRKQRRNAKQHHTNNTTDKLNNIITHSISCDTSCVDVQKDNRKNNNNKLHSNSIASNDNSNNTIIPCITCMSRQRLAYALFAKKSSIACVGVIKAEKNHELLKALMLYGRVLHEYYAELMHRYNITTQV